jgi:hypothetical protein
MASQTAGSTTDSLSGLAQGILSDVEKLIGQQFSLIRRDLTTELEKAAAAGLSVSTGAGATAIGGLFGAMAAVHLIREVTGLPLWASYAIADCGMCAIGAGLVTAGVEKASDINLIPDFSGERSDGRTSERQPTAAIG